MACLIVWETRNSPMLVIQSEVAAAAVATLKWRGEKGISTETNENMPIMMNWKRGKERELCKSVTFNWRTEDDHLLRDIRRLSLYPSLSLPKPSINPDLTTFFALRLNSAQLVSRLIWRHYNGFPPSSRLTEDKSRAPIDTSSIKCCCWNSKLRLIVQVRSCLRSRYECQKTSASLSCEHWTAVHFLALVTTVRRVPSLSWASVSGAYWALESVICDCDFGCVCVCGRTIKTVSTLSVLLVCTHVFSLVLSCPALPANGEKWGPQCLNWFSGEKWWRVKVCSVDIGAVQSGSSSRVVQCPRRPLLTYDCLTAASQSVRQCCPLPHKVTNSSNSSGRMSAS